MKLLVLYEELAAYFVNSILTFAQNYSFEIHIIHKQFAPSAPFEINFKNIHHYERENYSPSELIKLASKISPNAILCGGWANKTYLEIVSSYRGKIPTIVGFDNKWTGSLKQKTAALISPFYLKIKFDKCFVPGIEQKIFALKMGFAENYIATGAYCCDYDFYSKQFIENKEKKQKTFPKKFIYVGRYVENKGIRDLWSAFIELQNENPNEWELWCLGVGDVSPVTHPQIKHFGFIQPSDMIQFISQCGVFVLPSHFEPWGVVVHEFVSAGFPVLCSNEVGARVTFVENNFNGFIFNSGNSDQLKNSLSKIISMSDSELNRMAENSTTKAKEITPKKWSETLMKLINN